MRRGAGAQTLSPYKIGGCCSLCDEPCFEVMQRWDEGELRAGEPKVIGPPNNDSVRIAFRLFNGGVTDMTFCGRCAADLGTQHYAVLWRKNLAGYMREQKGNPTRFAKEFANGLLAEIHRTPWKELVKHVR